MQGPIPYLLKKLQAVGVVIICKVNHTLRRLTHPDVLPQPAQPLVPLLHATGLQPVGVSLLELAILWGRNVQMSEDQARVFQEVRHQVGSQG